MKVFKQVSTSQREREGERERERERDVLFRQVVLSAKAGLHKSRVKKCIYLSPISR